MERSNSPHKIIIHKRNMSKGNNSTAFKIPRANPLSVCERQTRKRKSLLHSLIKNEKLLT